MTVPSLPLNLSAAVQSNRRYAAALLWSVRFPQLSQVLGVDDSVTEAEFAAAVASWQRARPPLMPDGVLGPRSWARLELETRFSTARPRWPAWLTPSADTDTLAVPPWVAMARKEVARGVREEKGIGSNNPRILEYINTFGYLGDIDHKVKDRRSGNKVASGKKMSEVDETPWCACFVNWCLINAGQPRGPSARARDWLDYGTKISTPRLGAIAVVYHTPGASTAGTTSSGYHVAFYTGGAGNSVTLLGGNQGDAASEKTYKGYWTVQGYTWPKPGK